jgi:hypothetical protein
MREFSPFEKDAIRIMISDKRSLGIVSQNFETLVRNLFHGSSIDIDINPIGSVVTVSYHADNIDEILKINEIIDKLISLQVLFEYLQNEYLVRLYNYGFDGSSIQDDKAKKYNVSKEIPDQMVNDFYCTHWSDAFYITDALVVLADNDFETDEQIRHNIQMLDTHSKHDQAMRNARLQLAGVKRQITYAKRSLCVSWSAFAVSCVALVATLSLSKCSTSINAEQLESINQSIQDSKIETPINAIILNDTLPVNIINAVTIPVDLQVFPFPKVIQAEILNDTLQVKIANESLSE